MSHGSEGIRGGPPPVERRGACGEVAAVLEIKTTGWKTVTMVVRGEAAHATWLARLEYDVPVPDLTIPYAASRPWSGAGL
jgi:hypothetical protein